MQKQSHFITDSIVQWFSSKLVPNHSSLPLICDSNSWKTKILESEVTLKCQYSHSRACRKSCLVVLDFKIFFLCNYMELLKLPYSMGKDLVKPYSN